MTMRPHPTSSASQAIGGHARIRLPNPRRILLCTIQHLFDLQGHFRVNSFDVNTCQIF